MMLFAFTPAISVFADTSNLSRDSDTTPFSVPTTGTRLSMYRGFALGSCYDSDPNGAAGPTTFPANTPFFVRHGWVFSTLTPYTNQTLGAFNRPTTTFELYVDHVEQKSQPDYSSGNGFQLRLHVINFPNGMTGTHLFQGWWFQDSYFTTGVGGSEVFALGCNLQITFT